MEGRAACGVRVFPPAGCEGESDDATYNQFGGSSHAAGRSADDNGCSRGRPGGPSSLAARPVGVDPVFRGSMEGRLLAELLRQLRHRPPRSAAGRGTRPGRRSVGRRSRRPAPVNVRVRRLEGNFNTVTLRPSRYGIVGTKIGGDTVEFTIHPGQKVSVEFDTEVKQWCYTGSPYGLPCVKDSMMVFADVYKTTSALDGIPESDKYYVHAREPRGDAVRSRGHTEPGRQEHVGQRRRQEGRCVQPRRVPHRLLAGGE